MFGTLDTPGQAQFAGTGEALQRLSERMMDCWLAFTRTGDPSCGPNQVWPAYDLERRPTMVFDRESGLVTALMRCAPGAVLPDHEHVKIEQTYVLEGKLVDKEGPAAGLEVKPGEFVWREEGSRHVAWTPEGGLMLAMFQIPNKFHERDGRVTDLGGQDWESVWGHALKE